METLDDMLKVDPLSSRRFPSICSSQGEVPRGPPSETWLSIIDRPEERDYMKRAPCSDLGLNHLSSHAQIHVVMQVHRCCILPGVVSFDVRSPEAARPDTPLASQDPHHLRASGSGSAPPRDRSRSGDDGFEDSEDDGD